MSDISTRLKWAREQRGFLSAADAAKALGIPYGTYSGHENGLRGIPRDRVKEYARKFRVSADWLLTGEGQAPRAEIPVVGFAGAGPEGSVMFAHSDGELGEAPVPPGATERTVALEVSGDSMRGVADDGWLIYYDDRRDPPEADLSGMLCVAGLPDGRVLIKTLVARGDGLFDLESINAPTLRDQVLEWAAPVTAIIPRPRMRGARRRSP